MQIAYATRYRCDACRAESDIPRDFDPTTRTPVPEGWASGFRFETWRSGAGYPVSDLCPECACMSVRELIKMLEEKRDG